VLSWDEVVPLFGQVLGKRVRPIPLLVAVAQVNQILLSPLGDGPANIMWMLRMPGSVDSAYYTFEADCWLDRRMITMREFLEQKVNLPVAQIISK